MEKRRKQKLISAKGFYQGDPCLVMRDKDYGDWINKYYGENGFYSVDNLFIYITDGDTESGAWGIIPKELFSHKTQLEANLPRGFIDIEDEKILLNGKEI